MMSHLKSFAKAYFPFLAPVWRRISTKSPARVFTEIYHQRRWGDEQSLSGPGSSVEESASVRAALPLLVKELKCRSLLDIPCGDFFWMRMVDLDTQYIGGDIVGELIKKNKRNYGDAKRSFVRLDLIKDRLPRADLVICRDCLIHLSYAHALRALSNIKRSGATHLLASTYTARKTNRNIQTGGWRPINLQLPPYDLPKPMKLIDEHCPLEDYRDKSLGLWRTAEIPDYV